MEGGTEKKREKDNSLRAAALAQGNFSEPNACRRHGLSGLMMILHTVRPFCCLNWDSIDRPPILSIQCNNLEHCADHALITVWLSDWASAILIIIRPDWIRTGFGQELKKKTLILQIWKSINKFKKAGETESEMRRETSSPKSKNKRKSLEGDQGTRHPLIDESSKHEQRNV